METIPSVPCEKCGVEESHVRKLEKQIRELREKLEHSQLQNAFLTSECSRFQQELREAAFRRGSRGPPIPLPNEILRHIFLLATDIDGLAFAHWHEDTERDWELSSRTRCTIPLVCRQWNVIGIEFLFRHVVLRRESQAQALSLTLDTLDISNQNRLLAYIDGMELVMREEADWSQVFRRLAGKLITKLPKGQLRKFGIDCGGCGGMRTVLITHIIMDALKSSGRRLDILHIPCLTKSLPHDISEMANMWKPISSVDFQLHTLSTMSGYWHQCTGVFGIQHERMFPPVLGRKFGSVKTLYFTHAFFRGNNDKGFLNFFDNTPNTEVLHFPIVSELGEATVLPDILEKLPRLRHLFLIYQIWYDSTTFWSMEGSHSSLEEVGMISTAGWSSGGTTSFIVGLADHIKSSKYPKLKRITMHGRIPDGCLDPGSLIPHSHVQKWVQSIDYFAEVGIALVNQEGQPIHLWRQRHAIKWREESVSNSSGSESEGDQWYETSDEDRETPYVSSKSGSISNDSDDEPYRYVHQRDLRPFISDSEGDDE